MVDGEVEGTGVVAVGRVWEWWCIRRGAVDGVLILSPVLASMLLFSMR